MGALQTPVAPLLVCHKLLRVPLPARLRQVRMLVFLARLHRHRGQGTRVRTTQITGVVGILDVKDSEYCPLVRQSSNRYVRIGYHPR